jgi:hypothetical protein
VKPASGKDPLILIAKLLEIVAHSAEMLMPLSIVASGAPSLPLTWFLAYEIWSENL